MATTSRPTNPAGDQLLYPAPLLSPARRRQSSAVEITRAAMRTLRAAEGAVEAPNRDC